MTAAEVLDDVRNRLNDPDGDRYVDATLLAFLNAGMRTLYSRRPSCVILETDEAIGIQPPTSVVAETEVVAIHDRFQPALVNYVLWQAYAMDTDQHEATNPLGLAAFHRSAFESDAVNL